MVEDFIVEFFTDINFEICKKKYKYFVGIHICIIRGFMAPRSVGRVVGQNIVKSVISEKRRKEVVILELGKGRPKPQDRIRYT